jgi:hypothetical protein
MKFSRLVLVGLALGSLGLSTLEAFARLSASARAGAITTVALVNTSTRAVSTVLSPFIGLQFKKGDIPTWPAFSRHDTRDTCVYSQGLRRNWSDGSIKHLTVRIRCPGAVVGNATLVVNVAAGGKQPTPSARTTTELSNALINVTGVGQINLSGTWVSTLSDGVASAFKWIDGDAGAGWIVDTDFKQSGVAHGQLKARYYTFLTTDGEGGLGGIEFLPRVWQPLYDQDTPAKNWRGFSSLVINHGTRPLRISIPWPFNASNFTWTGGKTFAAPSNNYYSGSSDSGGGMGLVPVILSTTGTLPAPLTTGQIYFATGYTGNTNVNLTTGSGGAANGGSLTATNAGSGTHTMTPILTCLHFGSIFGATQDAMWNYIQGSGSLASAPTLRVQRDLTYWHTTRTIPPYDLSLAKSVPDNAPWAYNWSPVTTATLGQAIGAAGERRDLGPFNSYQVKHLFHQTAANEKLVRAIGLTSDLLVYNLRDKTNFAIPNVGNPNTTYAGFGGNKAKILQWVPPEAASGFKGPPNNNKTMAFASNGFSHMPNMAYYAYIWSGEPQFLDLLIELGDGAIYRYSADNGHRNPTLPAPGGYAIVTGVPIEARAGAWQLERLSEAAGIVPDNSPDDIDYKSYFMDSANSSLAWMNTTIANLNPWAAANGFHIFHSFVNNVTKENAVWQRAYLIFAVDMATGLLESADGLTLLDHFGTWYQHETATWGDYNRYHYYSLASSDDTYPPTVPIASDAQWAGVMPATTGGKISWTAGTPGVFTAIPRDTTGYVITNGDKFIFTTVALSASSTGFVPGGLAAMKSYYVVNKSGNTFNLSATPGGSPVAVTNTSSTPTGSVALIATTLSSTAIISGGGSALGYPALVMGSATWAKALGARGFDHVISDALTRLQASGGYTPSSDPKYTMQSSF